jgi:hypothetical protein
MKKNIKTTQKYQKKIKNIVGVKFSINMAVFEVNRLSWKPYIDFDAMNVTINNKTYFVAGRKMTPLSNYSHSNNKWTQ